MSTKPVLFLRTGEPMHDPRLDRLPDLDARNRDYPIRALVAEAKPLVTKSWACDVWLDQGSEGACVGFGIAHELAAAPAPVPGMTDKYARENIYWAAQKIDGWPGGSYPGAKYKYEGTSVVAGAKIAKKLGHIGGFYWAFGLEQVLRGIAHQGPAVLGLPWYEGMMSADADGFIEPTGEQIGGHCILAQAVDVEDRTVTLHNSWGKDWGKNGRCRIRWEDLDLVLKNQGEACFFTGRVEIAV